MIEVEDKRIMQPFGDRSKVVIEPMLTDQWYVDAKTLAEPALASVKEGRTNFVPKNWEKTYFEWMENIEPWCISRQLWWGHQIPAWYGPDDHIFVAEDEEVALDMAVQHYLAHEGPWKAWVEEKMNDFKPGEILTRDPDVLDTWFSSALWPFSTLGWPEETPELKRYYQTDVLVTGFDIIFFWVARMMMMGLHFMKDEHGQPVEPFHTIYIHALVRDEHGAKMSKSKGNVLDPLVLIDEFGADAVRFTLAAMAAQGRDIKLSTQRIGGYRNFATKLWNAVRFAQLNGAEHQADFDPSTVKEPVNQWVLTEASRAIAEINDALNGYRFNDAAGAAYKFTWNLFCDWYLELLKPTLNGEDGPAKDEARATMAYVIDTILALLHPFMPFITEELWPAGAKMTLSVISPEDEIRERLRAHEETICRLARLDGFAFVEAAPKGTAALLIDDTEAALPLEGFIDMAAEQARLEKEIEKAELEIKKIDGKLSNPNFVNKAPEAVVEENRERRVDFEAQITRFSAALARLKAAA
jgi:valyl-tRNA synthetase